MMASSRQVATYGSWSSAVSAEALAAAQISFENLRAVNGRLYWTQNLPAEGGAVAVFSLPGSTTPVQMTPPGANVRSRVHEYGGAPFVVVGETLYYTRFADQQLYSLAPGETPQALTPPGYRYADAVPQRDAQGNVIALICVREDHTNPKDIRNAIVRVALPVGGAGDVLYGESDFVAYPRLSVDGTQLAFIAWRHPNMPWDATELWLASVTPGGIGTPVRIAAQSQPEAILEPQWDADGTLYFISDRSGFWNLYGWRAGAGQAIHPRAAEFANPLWQLGQANYALLGGGRALARFDEGGREYLTLIDLMSGAATPLDLPYIEYSQLCRLDDRRVAFIAGSATAPRAIVQLDVESGTSNVLVDAGRAVLTPAAVSAAQPIDFPSAAGRTAHAFYYPPLNPGFEAPAGERPPVIALVHGGPTGKGSPAYSAAIQFWTSRGIAVVDVNYAGSSGFGRAYRQALNGQWGIFDAEDVSAAVGFLGSTGHIDPQRTAIRGGSAGGYTVLLALCTSEVFHAGADYYGISDMMAIAQDTHKFESRYLDSLIGPLPQSQALYASRSPLNHLAGFKAPLIVFQGAEDPVVPPNQSAMIVEALRERRAPVAYLLYPGEGHGFRNPVNVIQSLKAELSFYGQVFGFTPADALPPLKIENLSS